MTPRHILMSLCAAALCSLLGACSGTPDGVLSKEKMARLMADIHEAEGVADTERATYASDSMRRVLRQSVYAHNGVTQEDVDSSFSWYGHHIEKYMDVYDRVIEILDERMNAANTLSARTGTHDDDPFGRVIALEGDSVDIWAAPRHRRFYTLGGAPYVVYTANPDRNWEPGDTYTLAFKAINPTHPVEFILVAEYDDGSFAQQQRSSSQPGWNKLDLTIAPESSGRRARSLSAVIHYEPRGGEQMYIDSISLVRRHPRFTLPAAHAESDSIPSSR